jgi:hypothetical protein
VICLLLGGEVPVILRPDGEKEPDEQEEKTRFTFVGECYLDGYMDGEGLPDTDDFDSYEWDVFHIV